MVKCYACGKKFDDSEFFRHARQEHGSVEDAIFEIERIRMSPQEFMELDFKGVITAEYSDGIAIIKRLRGLADIDIYIDVWNCHGILHYGKDDGEDELVSIGYFSIPKRLYKDEIRDELEKLCFEILRDRGGAINKSGRYYLDKEHIDRLSRLISTP